ncbi:MAG: glycosyltransferase family 4 protein, partial [bacterium]|nr:glycosyltransferase family 4 protein [bacterium]
DWLPMLVARLAGIPVVLTIHNVFPHDRAEREVTGMNLALDLIYRSAHALIVHGDANRRELLDFFPLDPSRIVDIPHGDYQFARQDQTYSPSEARDRLGLPQEAPVALCFGAIREYKGIHLLIPAFARVHQNLPQARLMVVGKPAGTDAETYSRLIHQHNLENAVLFKPEYIDLEEIGLYFAAADLAVYPYLKVYQSGALQLAYAFGKPVIVTAVGALPETVEEGLNGHIIPPGSIDALATALEASLSAPSDTLRQMGQRSLELARTRYGWPEIAQSTLQVYRQVVREAQHR